MVRLVWYGFATATVVLAAGFGVARLLLPFANEYTETIEIEASATLGQPVKIKSLDAEWHGFTPTLVLKDVEMYNKKNTDVLMRFPKIRLGLDVFDSVVLQRVMFTRFDLAGVNLFITRDVTGKFHVRGVDTDTSGDNRQAGVDFQDWLFQQDRLSLELLNLVYIDQSASGSKVHHFSNVTVILRNSGDRHQIDGVFRFPGHLDQELLVSLDTATNPLELSDWSGKIYLSGVKIPVAQVFGMVEFHGYQLAAGTADFKVWLELKRSRVNLVQGSWSSSELAIRHGDNVAGTERILSYPVLAGQFMWRDGAEGWQVNVKEFHLKGTQGDWPATLLTVSYQGAADKPLLGVHASFLQLDDVHGWIDYFQAELPADVLSMLRQWKVSGQLKNVFLQTAYRDQTKVELDLQLQDVGIHLTEAGLDIRGLSGHLHFADNVGTFFMDGKLIDKKLMDEKLMDGKATNGTATELSYPAVFSNRLNLGQLSGRVRWELRPGGLSLSSDDLSVENSDFHLKTRGSIGIDASEGRGPLLDIHGELLRGRVENVYHYLPTQLFSVATNDWLRAALRGGNVTGGDFTLRGQAQDFPFLQNNGLFEVNVGVTEGRLNYATGWPEISNIQAKLMFSGTRMLVEAANANIFSSSLRKVRVELPDMHATAPTIEIQGEVFGPTQDKLIYLRQAPPLKKKYGGLAAQVKAKGGSTLALNIQLKLDQELKTRLSGRLSLQNNSFDLDVLGDVITAASGDIDILSEGLRARSLQAVLFGEPARITINTAAAEQKGLRDDFIDVHVDGAFSAPQLTKRYAPVFSDLVQGSAPWTLDISIPLYKFARNIRGDKGVSVDIESELNGVALRLPSPFGKAQTEKKRVQVSMTFAEDGSVLYRGRYGGYFDGIFKQAKANSLADFRGEVRFGSGHAILPSDAGVRLVGQMEEFSADIWRSLLSQFKLPPVSGATPVMQKETHSYVNLLKAADLSIRRFSLFGQKVENLQLLIQNSSHSLRAELNSKAIKGVIEVPRDLVNQALIMNLDYWHLIAEEIGSSGVMDPRELPAIKADIGLVTYQQRKFGKVSLATTKLVEGLRLEKLILEPTATRISGVGKWVVDRSQQVSEFQMHLDSENLGETMQDLGYLNTIVGGKGNVVAEVRWPGSLTNINLEKVTGSVKFSLADGRLLEYDPIGSAGILGLFSIQTLPKRLLLDFSDLYKKGLEFSTIGGEFSVEDGNAYTKNFTMEGAIVSATVAGRIGLVDQDYDQLIKVDVHVADFISFIGLLAVSPWSVILPQILKDQFKTTLEYSLKGSWGDPTLQPILQQHEAFDAVNF